MDYLKVCELAARTGGEALLSWAGKFSVKEKGPADLVTEADLASQDAIRDIVLSAFPKHGFIGEETPEGFQIEADYRWIVDPLDGTTNYVHGVPDYCVSVALEHRGCIIVGTIYDPSSGECFAAEKGKGAYLNGQRIVTSKTREIGEALVAAGFPPKVKRDSIELRHFIEAAVQCHSMRRMGSAALNLCYVASGRYDAYWTTNTKAWDVAAGMLMVQEAGGSLTCLDGGNIDLFQPRFIAAGTNSLGQKLREMLLSVR